MKQIQSDIVRLSELADKIINSDVIKQEQLIILSGLLDKLSNKYPDKDKKFFKRLV